MIAALAFLLAATPLAVIAARSDLKTMKIPNWVSIALICLFIPLGLIFLPWETVLWRLLAGFLMLVFTFLLNMIGQMGGGDAKLLAASAPYVSWDTDIQILLWIIAGALWLTLILHLIARRIPFIRRVTPDWESWEAGRYFPMGTSIAVALVAYLIYALNLTL